ncbi:MAG: glycosyltransferase [Capsulimonadales bacterium]|nr:glycosyltransferase [Capsulimonadales bacterium]
MSADGGGDGRFLAAGDCRGGGELVARARLLFLAQLLPWPLIGGGQIRSYYLLRSLAEDYDIRLLSLIRRESERAYLSEVAPFCRLGAETVRLRRDRLRDGWTAAASVLTGRSFLVERDRAAGMTGAVRREIAGGGYDLIWADHLPMIGFVPEDRGRARLVLGEHNVEYRIPERYAETADAFWLRAFARAESLRLKRFETASVRRADWTVTVSEEDARTLRSLVPECSDRVFSVPIGIDTGYFSPLERDPNARTLLSIGTMYWPPNVDAIHYFHERIYPKIKAEFPSVRLNIVGTGPVSSIVALGKADESVTVTGTVPDVRPYGRDCAAFIVPLRSGSGMRVKILNAMAMGLPVVSTTMGAEGIDVTPERDILLADTPEAFASAVLSLLRSPDRAEELGRNGRRLAEARYSWQRVGSDLRSALRARLAGGGAAAG